MRRTSSIRKTVLGTVLVIVLIAVLIVISASIADSRAVGSVDDNVRLEVVRQDHASDRVGMFLHEL